jgi:hypothetical protein
MTSMWVHEVYEVYEVYGAVALRYSEDNESVELKLAISFDRDTVHVVLLSLPLVSSSHLHYSRHLTLSHGLA